jgi:alpha-N-acetylglucosaminidase
MERVLPGRSGEFLLEAIPAGQGTDVFEVDSRAGKIVLRGNNGVALASAFNWYLKYTAHCDFSECGTQLHLPAALPPVKEKVHRAATVPHRFMFNYCTFGYTMPWWDWPRWERELDWMAMNGINLPFVLTGQEAVWINTLTQFNYSEKEIRQWLGSPAHFPWTFMQNMENFGGELPASWVPQRVALAQKIIRRAHDLGMNVTLQGYYGMVPPNFAKRNPGVKVLPQGGWAGGLKRPDMLDPTDPMFARIAATFMREQEKLFGRAGFYTADPFHEGGNAKGVDMTDCGRRVLAAMRAADPAAVWVKMCWQSDNAKLLADIPPDRVLALDLWAEARPFWPNGAFKGKNWVWCLLQNFGGNSELNADLAHLAKVFPSVLANPNKGRLSGLAFTPEGHCNAPVVYELMPEFVWRDQPVALNSWISDYVQRRYGADSAQARAAWAGFQKTLYGVRAAHETPDNNIFAARPLRGEKARTWSTTKIPYDPAALVPAWDALLDAAPECGASDAYCYDLADVSRQVMGDLSHAIYDRINTALAARDLAAFKKNQALFLQILSDLDRLLGTRQEFLLGAWIADARRWGTTDAERNLYEWQARTLLTTWDDKPGSDLNDYANRSWNGLVKDYYAMRWALYFNAQGAALQSGKPFDQSGFLKQLAAAELAWTKAHQPYPTQPVGEVIPTVRALREKYGALLRETYPTPLKPKRVEVLGCWRYAAEGTHFLREFRGDGTIQSYETDGTKLNWFEGFHWRIEGNAIVAERPSDGLIVTHTLAAPGVLDFTSEGFGSARRVPLPQ